MGLVDLSPLADVPLMFIYTAGSSRLQRAKVMDFQLAIIKAPSAFLSLAFYCEILLRLRRPC